MADAVAALLEATVPHVLALRQRGVLSPEEVKSISARRESFELALRRRPAPERSDFLRYAQYELNLQTLVERRAARLSVRLRGGVRFAIIRRVHSIFERSLQRFSHDASLWREYIRFCEAQKAHRVLSRVLSRALQRHPRAADLWERAGTFEFERLRNVHAARSLFQRGLRLCSGAQQDSERGALVGSRRTHAVVAGAAVAGNSRVGRRKSAALLNEDDEGSSSGSEGAARVAAQSLWLAYLSMELKYLDIMRKRQNILSGAADAPTAPSRRQEQQSASDGTEGNAAALDNLSSDDSSGRSGSESSDESSDGDSVIDSDSEADIGAINVEMSDFDDAEMDDGIAPAVDAQASDESSDDFWNGGIPRIVCLQAFAAIPESCKFRLKMLALVERYEFGAAAAAELRASLERDFFPHNPSAVRYLAEQKHSGETSGSKSAARVACAVYDKAVDLLSKNEDFVALGKVLESYAAFAAGLLARSRAARSKDCDWIQEKYSSVMREGARVSPQLCVQWVELQATQCGGDVPQTVLDQLGFWLIPSQGNGVRGSTLRPEVSGSKEAGPAVRSSARVWGCYAGAYCAEFDSRRTIKRREKALAVFKHGITACVQARIAAARFDVQEARHTASDHISDLRNLYEDYLAFWIRSLRAVHPSALSPADLCAFFIKFQDEVLTDIAVGPVPLDVVDAVRLAFLHLAHAQMTSPVEPVFGPAHVRSTIAALMRLPLPPSVQYQLAVLRFECEVKLSSAMTDDLRRAMDRALTECAAQGSASEPLWLECIRICAGCGDWVGASRYVWRSKQELPIQSDSFLQQVVGMGVGV